jgi:hypothetical protein
MFPNGENHKAYFQFDFPRLEFLAEKGLELLLVEED